jgi:hypothetical protein
MRKLLADLCMSLCATLLASGVLSAQEGLAATPVAEPKSNAEMQGAPPSAALTDQGLTHSDLDRYCKRRKPISEVVSSANREQRLKYAEEGSTLIRECTRRLLDELKSLVEKNDDADVHWRDFDQRLRRLIDTLQGAINEIMNHGGLVDLIERTKAKFVARRDQIADVYRDPQEQQRAIQQLDSLVASASDAQKNLETKAKSLNDQLLALVKMRPQLAFQFSIDRSKRLLIGLDALAENITRSTEDLRDVIDKALPASAAQILEQSARGEN